MGKFRKSVIIEAEQWFPGKEVEGVYDANVRSCGHSVQRGPHCHTLKGALNVSPGDWIIKGINGEFYPCNPDIFISTYEPTLSNGWKPPQEPALKALGMNIDEATERACKESTLLDALTFICIWESERVVKQARENKTWETCFRRCLKSVLDTYAKVEPAEGKLISRTIIQATIDYVMQLDMIADPNIRDNVETAVIEGAKAQLVHNKARMEVQADDSGSLAAWIKEKADESELQLEGELLTNEELQDVVREMPDVPSSLDWLLTSEDAQISGLLWIKDLLHQVCKAQLAHDRQKIEELEIDYQMLSEEAKGLSDENKELKATMVRLPREELLISYLKQIDNTLNVNRWLSEYGKSEERFFLAAQELLKLLKGEYDEA